MRKQEAEKILESWLNPVLGFALKRCKTPEDAEDLSQEIILRVYRALLLRDDVEDVSKFIWTVAHNALCNYYRSASRNMIGIPVEAVADLPAESAEEAGETAEAVERLKKEIAYLSGLQRKIVIAYYIDHKKQEQIARELGIPVGTVKWHLFEAKKELKKGMGKMREASSLKYNPVRFVTRGITGSLGRKDVYDMFGSPLVQNLCYAVRDTWKTVNEIADDITKDMERGVTALKAVGWYTQTDRLVLMVMIRRTELSDLVKSIKDVDSKAFVTVVPANNVYGEGFDEIKVGLPRKKKNQ